MEQAGGSEQGETMRRVGRDGMDMGEMRLECRACGL